MAWHDFIWKIRPKHMAVLMLIVSGLPLFVSLGIPMTASYLSTDYYNTVVSQADIAKAAGRRPVRARGELFYNVMPGFKDKQAAETIQSIQNNYALLFVVLDTTSHINVLDVMKRYKLAYQMPGETEILGGPYKYGIDWVVTPAILGEEPAMQRVAADIWEACAGHDFFGTPFSALPMMANLHSFRDVDVSSGFFYSGTHVEMFVRQWTNANPNYPNIKGVGDFAYEDIAYAWGRFIFGTDAGLRGAAEYETLVNFKGYFGRPAEDQAKIEARNTQLIALFACIALGAVHLGMEKRRQTAHTAAQASKEA